MTNKFYIFLVIIMLAFSWYWFSYRPIQVRENCQAEQEHYWPISTSTDYARCLAEHGQ